MLVSQLKDVFIWYTIAILAENVVCGLDMWGFDTIFQLHVVCDLVLLC